MTASQESERTVEKVRLLGALIDALSGAAELEEIYQHALDGLETALGVSRSAILLLDERNVSRFVAWRGLSDAYRQRVEGHFPWAVDALDPAAVVIPDVTADSQFATLHDAFRREHIGALAFIPLVYHRRLIGKFVLYRAEPYELSTEELALARTIGRLIAFAVERSKVERALRDADLRKDEFLAMLAHELRNPLGALALAVDVLATRSDGSVPPTLGIAKRQVRNLSRLIDDLLDLSRITRGLVELRKEPVELSTVVARVVEDVRPMLDQRNHQMFVSVPTRRLVVDPVRFEQILSNLVGNAVKYTPHGGEITIQAISEPDCVVLSVTDNGIGMTPDLLEHVFDLFMQGKRRLDRAQGGLGIGLTITKQLVALHGGTITAASEGPGHGSTFTVIIPARADGIRARPVEEVDITTKPRHHERRVLIVDDNVDMTNALAELVRGWGYQVETHLSAPSALDSVWRTVPDVIVLDIGLPEIDGYELAATLRAMPELASTTLIAMSGYGQHSDISRSLATGFAAHLVKPIQPQELRRLLELPPPPAPAHRPAEPAEHRP